MLFTVNCVPPNTNAHPTKMINTTILAEDTYLIALCTPEAAQVIPTTAITDMITGAITCSGSEVPMAYFKPASICSVAIPTLTPSVATIMYMYSQLTILPGSPFSPLSPSRG